MVEWIYTLDWVCRMCPKSVPLLAPDTVLWWSHHPRLALDVYSCLRSVRIDHLTCTEVDVPGQLYQNLPEARSLTPPWCHRSSTPDSTLADHCSALGGSHYSVFGTDFLIYQVAICWWDYITLIDFVSGRIHQTSVVLRHQVAHGKTVIRCSGDVDMVL